jgi:penicillin amidase
VLDGSEHALALQSTALEPNEGFDGFAYLNEARNWDEFVAAVQRIESPSLNLLYADKKDNIGYYVSGKVPIRANGLGMVPAVGWNGENEWIGYVPFEKMPHVLNPRDGFLVTANNRIVDDNYPYHLGSLWMNGYRARRIRDLIQEKNRISVGDCMRFQMDLSSIPGRQVVKALENFATSDNDAVTALNLLRQWDGWLGPDSSSGAVYQVFLATITREILNPLLGTTLTSDYLGTGTHPILVPITEFHGQWIPILLRALANPASKLWEAPGSHQELIQLSLAGTVSQLRSRFGDDISSWCWGRDRSVRYHGRRPIL